MLGFVPQPCLRGLQHFTDAAMADCIRGICGQPGNPTPNRERTSELLLGGIVSRCPIGDTMRPRIIRTLQLLLQG